MDEQTRLEGIVSKGWGHENIFVTNDKYCGKILSFKKDGKFSMHLHRNKTETWFVLSGRFQLEIILTSDASRRIIILEPGDVWTNDIMNPHQLTCLEVGEIIEVSTPDSVEDNYRILPGHSQTPIRLNPTKDQ